MSQKEGNAQVKLILKDNEKNLTFKLKEKRQIDRKIINTLINEEISTLIS